MSARSFVSFDSADGLGVRAQVIVKVGSLPVAEVRDGTSGIAKVVFDHAAGGLEFAVTANVPTESPVAGYARDAVGTGREVAYRVETQRKADVDRRLPFPPPKEKDRKADKTYLSTQGTKDNEVVAILVALDDVTSDEGVTDPADDTRWASVPRAQVPDFIEADPNSATASAGFDVDRGLKLLASLRVNKQVPDSVVSAVTAQLLLAGVPVGKALDLSAEESQRPARKQVVAADEAPPWRAFNQDSFANAGQYAFRRLFHLEQVAGGIYTDALGDSLDAADLYAKKTRLATVLFGMANDVQAGYYGSHRPPQINVASHHLIADMLEESIRHRHPVPLNSTEEERAAWRQAVVGEVVEHLRDMASWLYGPDAVPDRDAARAERDAERAAAKTPTDKAAAAKPSGPRQPVPAETAPAAATADDEDTGDGAGPGQDANPLGGALPGDTQPVNAEASGEQPPGEPAEPTTASDVADQHEPLDEQRVALLARLRSRLMEAGINPAAPGNPLQTMLQQRWGLSFAKDLDLDRLQKFVAWVDKQQPQGLRDYFAQFESTAA